MNGMPFDMVLTQPLAETFQAGGLAKDIPGAHTLAWAALESSLGDPTLNGDSVDAWSMKFMQHSYHPDPEHPGVQFSAEFVRNPEFVDEG